MDVIATLVEVQVYDPVGFTTRTLRFCNRNDPRAVSHNGVEWRPILLSSPTLGISVFNGAFTGKGQVDLQGFEISLLDSDLDQLARYTWHGAVVSVYAGDMTTGNFPLVFMATGDGASRTGKTTLSISVKSRDALLDRNLLYLSYAGTGDIEGSAELTGTLKPFVYGDAKFCSPVLIDPVRQIYQVHGYGPVESIYAVFEGGQAIGTSGNPSASYSIASGHSYAAFRDGAVAQGQWIRFNDLGLIKLGSQPSFPLTCHARGDSGGVNGGTHLYQAGDIVNRLVTMATSVPVKAGSRSNLNAIMGGIPINNYYDGQITVDEALQDIMLPIGGYTTWNESGELIMGLVRFVASSMTLSGNNDQLPTVLGINQLATSAPAWHLKLGAEQCHFVHDASNVVQSIVDLQAAVTTAQATASGKNKTFPPSSAPPEGAITGDTWPDTSTSPTTYRRFNGSTWIAISNYVTEGTHIGVENGANVTETRTALFIKDQGDLAKKNAVDLATAEVLNKSLANVDPTASGKLSGIAPGATVGAQSGTNLLKSDGTLLSDTHIVTSVGTSAFFNNQQDLATQDFVYFDSGYLRESLTGGNATYSNYRTDQGTAAYFNNQQDLATRDWISFDSAYMYEGVDGLVGATRSNFRTDQGTAAYFNNQGDLSVLDSLNYGSTYLTGFGGLAGRNNTRLGYEVYREDGLSVATEAALVTSQGTAAFFNNQQDLATQDYVYFDSGYIREAVDGLVNATRGNFRTDQGTAAYFNNQGDLSVLDSLGYGSTYLTGFGGLAGRNNARLGYEVYREDGIAVATEAALVTSQGTAAFFNNQQDLATQDYVYFDSGYVREAVDGINATRSNFRTDQGTAKFFTNQGDLSTRSGIKAGAGDGYWAGLWDEALSFQLTNAHIKTDVGTSAYFNNQQDLATEDFVYFGSNFIRETNGGAQATRGDYRTDQGTAQYITGQGDLAKQNSVTWGTQVSGYGKPTDFATSGDSVLPNPLFIGTTGWNINAAGFTHHAGTVSDPGNFVRTNAERTLVSDMVPIPVHNGNLFYSYWKRGSQAGLQVAFDIHYYDNAGTFITMHRNDRFDGSANAWVYHSFSQFVPPRAVYMQVAPILVCPAGQTHDIALIRVAPTEQGSTRGARAGDNLFRNNGVTLNDGDIITSSGTAAYINSQGDLATLGSIGFDSSYLTGDKPHRHAGKVIDTRNVNTLPDTYRTSASFFGNTGGKGSIEEFKETAAIGLAGSTYCHLFTTSKWENDSGGLIHQIATVDDGNVWERYGYSNGWHPWSRNYSDYHKPIFGADLREDASTLATLGNFKTSQGTAAYLNGEGALARQNSVTWGSQVTGTGKPVDNAGTTMRLHDPGHGQLEFIGNSIRKVAGGNWNMIYTEEFYYGGCFVSGQMPDAGAFIGLTRNRSYANTGGDHGYSDFLWHRSTDGNWYAFQGSSNVQLFGTAHNGVTFDANTAFQLVYEGTQVRWYANGVLMREQSTDAGRTYYASFGTDNGVGKRVTNLQFGPYADSNRSQKIGRLGRVADPLMYNTQNLLGIETTTDLAPSYTDAGGGNWSINLPAHNRRVAGVSSAESRYYGGTSGVLGPDTRWYAYYSDPDFAGNNAPVANFTTDANALLRSDAYRVASGVTPAAGTTNPPPPYYEDPIIVDTR